MIFLCSSREKLLDGGFFWYIMMKREKSMAEKKEAEKKIGKATAKVAAEKNVTAANIGFTKENNPNGLVPSTNLN